MNTSILYVEDDRDLGFVTKNLLEDEGFVVTLEKNGKDALQTFNQKDFDICLFDVMLPELDGFSLAKEVRKVNEAVPIIFITAKSLKEDKLEGLRLGADDYLTKPFSIEELILKIEIFLKRAKLANMPSVSNPRLGSFVFDHGMQSLQFEDQKKKLTKREADLLKYLSDHRNKIVKRSTILERIWGEDDYFLGRSLDVFISRLRKYLRSDERLSIENVHGVGFKLNCPE